MRPEDFRARLLVYVGEGEPAPVDKRNVVATNADLSGGLSKASWFDLLTPEDKDVCLAEMLAVVGRDDDERVIELVPKREIAKQPVDLRIKIGEAVVVGVGHQAHLSRGERRFVEDEPSLEQLPFVGRIGLRAEWGVEIGRRQVGVVGVEHVEIR